MLETIQLTVRGGPGQSVVIRVLDNDVDVDGDALSVQSRTNPPGGTATINQADNTITYRPNPTFSGVDSFTYTISDGNGIY